MSGPVTPLLPSDLLEGRRALVTGAGRGIGAAIARALASIGAHVVVADLDATAAQSTADGIAASGGSAEATSVDLSSRVLTREFARRQGHVDILVNNAGPRQTNGDFLEMPDDEWELQFGVLLWAPIILTQELGARMAAAGSGSIVNISSISVRNPTGHVAPYAVAKSGVETLTRITATELGPKGVRCNAVAPSFVPTERNRAVWERVGYDEETGLNRDGRRLLTPDDVAGVVAWVASPAAAHVNGQVIVAA